MGQESSDTFYLLAFFIIVIIIGTFLLLLPFSWSDSAESAGPLNFIDALFIATSAVCVTGLVTVNISDFSLFGQIVTLMLIQIGGLGIISFTSLLLMLPGHRLPFRRLHTIRGFSVGGVEYNPVKIVRNIVFYTFFIETAGILTLFPVFLKANVQNSFFAAIFHSISAFCNAGFSIFPNGLENFSNNIPLMLIVMILIVTGGIGFIVLQDIEKRLKGTKKSLSYHSKLILFITLFLILTGAIFFYFLEKNNAFSGMKPFNMVTNAFFQAITPRTAGFNTIKQVALSLPSKLLTIIFMFIGGSPGSIAGGIKISTAFLVMAVMLRRQNEKGEINAFWRRIPPETSKAAMIYFLKAFLILTIAIVALSISEGAKGISLEKIIFESVSAFGTVGLSLDFTPALSGISKFVLIGTMFTGRVGLIALAFPLRNGKNFHVIYPEADILVG